MKELIVDFSSGALSRCTKRISTVQSKLPFYTHGWLENSPPNFLCISPMQTLTLVKNPQNNKNPNKTKQKAKKLFLIILFRYESLSITRIKLMGNLLQSFQN